MIGEVPKVRSDVRGNLNKKVLESIINEQGTYSEQVG